MTRSSLNWFQKNFDTAILLPAGLGGVVRHGLGLAQYDQPVISRIWSLDHPLEIRPGMVFALETQHGKRYEFGVRIEEMLIVNDKGIEIISHFPVEQITCVE